MTGKLIGACMLILSGVSFGYSLSKDQEKTLHLLMEIRKSLLYLQSEIQYGKETLPKALEHMAQRCSGTLKEVYQFVSEQLEEGTCIHPEKIWEEAVAKQNLNKIIGEKETGKFVQLGIDLFYWEKETQIKRIRLYTEEMDLLIDETARELPGKKKMYETLGVCGGLLLVLLFY